MNEQSTAKPPAEAETEAAAEKQKIIAYAQKRGALAVGTGIAVFGVGIAPRGPGWRGNGSGGNRAFDGRSLSGGRRGRLAGAGEKAICRGDGINGRHIVTPDCRPGERNSIVCRELEAGLLDPALILAPCR